MSGKPLVSCICPTFNCPPLALALLEECVASFVNQDYDGSKELVIFNDNPAQTLTCNFQGVRVINHPLRIESLGKKYNWMVQAARGSIILPWEDDDISLPHRISQAVERINGYDYFNPRGSWFDDGKLHHTHSHGYLVNCSAITKEALLRVPFDNVSGNQDALWYYKADTLLNQSPHVLTSPREWSYIYRWGVRRHLSGFANTEQAYRDADKGIAGEYCITPRWHLDHKERVRLHLEKHGL